MHLHGCASHYRICINYNGVTTVIGCQFV